MTDLAGKTASQTAADVAAGRISASAVVEDALSRITAHDPRVGAFTAVLADRARAKARSVDAAIRSGARPGVLSGVPFGVKNLFDLDGIATVAGSKINRDDPPAMRDATLVERLEAAGAICLGALNMGEYAYDFTGENVHDGASRNPHDLRRMSGGSSGGSGSAVAAGFVPLSLGSDTNGSIRVPSSLCGLFGLKPTYGRLSRARTFPFVTSLDHLGPLARSVRDLSVSYDVMQGPDDADPAMAERPLEPTLPGLEAGVKGLRVGIAGGYFARSAEPEALDAVRRCAEALGAVVTVELPDVALARAAAYVITTSEGAALHLDRLKRRAGDFDPATRDRLLAGAMVPAAWVTRAQKFRRYFRDAVARCFEDIDILLAPATPCRAPLLGQATMTVGGDSLAVRANLGLFTQPLSLIGLPVVAVPLWTEADHLPIGVQVVGAPWREDLVLRVANHLEQSGVARSPVARL